jgi:hypothetical protein
VPQPEYEQHCRRLSETEAPRRFLYHLHRDPGGAMHHLIDKHMARRAELAHAEPRDGPPIDQTILDGQDEAITLMARCGDSMMSEILNSPNQAHAQC